MVCDRDLYILCIGTGCDRHLWWDVNYSSTRVMALLPRFEIRDNWGISLGDGPRRQALVTSTISHPNFRPIRVLWPEWRQDTWMALGTGSSIVIPWPH